eukprot:jgi/Botrbrau1/14625/Bobra.0364s0009.1
MDITVKKPPFSHTCVKWPYSVRPFQNTAISHLARVLSPSPPSTSWRRCSFGWADQDKQRRFRSCGTACC